MMSRRRDEQVLVLDGGEFSTLAIVRSLGRRGLRITLGASQPDAIARYSRYVDTFFVYPDPMLDSEGFLRAIEERVAGQPFEVLMPVTELTCLPLAKSRSRIEAHTRLALPPNTAFLAAIDKARTFELAAERGVPIPVTYRVDSLETLDACVAQVRFPCVIKPVRSIAEDKATRRRKMSVAFATNSAELRDTVRRMLPVSEVMVQEYCEGTGGGIEILADHGEVVHAFQHERMHELPLTGGGSCLRRAVPLDEDWLAHARALISALSWHGVAMVEFKRDAGGGTGSLMEINGRFWGSLPLAVSAGSDFPWFLYRLLVYGERPERSAGRAGPMSRKLREDLYWYLQTVFRRDPSPLIRWPSVGRMVKDGLLVLHPRHHFDAFSVRDPKPGFVEIGRASRWFSGLMWEHLREAWLRRRQRRLRDSGVALEQAQRARNWLFVCYGNINRSALAGQLARAGGEGAHGIDSTGLHPETGRPVDACMQDVAAEVGLDLSAPRSQTLSSRQMEWADAVFVMELEQLQRLARMFPRHRKKLLLLGALDSSRRAPLEIPDPYGKSAEHYRQCFRQVRICVDALLGHKPIKGRSEQPPVRSAS